MDIKEIKKVVVEFGKLGKVFTNEQNFQFEFALALKKLQDVKDVQLEVLSLPSNYKKFLNVASNNIKLPKGSKEYKDIFIETNSGEYIAIELKFKTPDKICYYSTPSSGDVITMRQGAHFINAYEFVNDIVRLENINTRLFSKNIKITKSYAILLTNNYQYRFNDFKGSPIWKNYAINNGKKLGPGKLAFPNGHYQTKSKTYEELSLKNCYDLIWENYPLSKYNKYGKVKHNEYPGFSFLIVEII